MNLNVTFISTLFILSIDLNDIWTKTPFTVERVISLSNYLRTATFSENRIQTSEYIKRK